MDRIVNREALEQVRETSKAQIENSRCRILICAGTGCLAGGSGKIYGCGSAFRSGDCPWRR